MSADEKSLYLPPFCEGKIRGNLSLVIENVYWKTSKSFNSIKVRVLWWGQLKGFSSEISKVTDRNPSKPLKTIIYQIQTNCRLFKSYLKNCEPLIVEFYSSKTSDYIGISKLDSFSELQTNSSSWKSSAKILSKRQFELGEMTVHFKLEDMSETKLYHQSNKTKSFRRGNILLDKNKLRKEKYISKENIQVNATPQTVPYCGSLKPKNFLLDIMPKWMEDNSNRKKMMTHRSNDVAEDMPLLTYLSGQPMSKFQKLHVLENLTEISPSRDTLVYLQKDTKQNLKEQGSIKIKIIKAEFNYCHQEELNSFIRQNSNSKFVLKCAITSKSFLTNVEIAMLSPAFEAFPQQVFRK